MTGPSKCVPGRGDLQANVVSVSCWLQLARRGLASVSASSRKNTLHCILLLHTLDCAMEASGGKNIYKYNPLPRVFYFQRVGENATRMERERKKKEHRTRSNKTTTKTKVSRSPLLRHTEETPD